MKQETYLKLRSQKRKAKLLALFTSLSLFGSTIKEIKANACESSITTNSSLVNVNGEIFDVSGVTDEIIAYAKRGSTEGPQALETWYPLDLSKVVENMEKLYGHTNLVYKVRNDGVKILSGTAPDGTKYEDLVMVAADVRSKANLNGTFERGEFVETTLGKGIIVDACGEAIIKRKYNKGVQFDIATAWHSQPYESIIYGKKSNKRTNTEEKQSNTKKTTIDESQLNDKIVLPPGITFNSEKYISAEDYFKSKKS